MKKTFLSLGGLIAVSALAAVEHNGVKYGPGLPDGADFEASKAEADALLAVGAVKLYDEGDATADGRASGNPAIADALDAEIARARAAAEDAAAAKAASEAALAEASALGAAATAAQLKADADAKAVAEERAKLAAEMQAFEDAKAAAAKAGGKKS